MPPKIELTMWEPSAEDRVWGESEDAKEYVRQMDEALAAMTDEEFEEQFGRPRST